ncbi:MAG: tRNA (N6-threonylcarbamoyladenosine(37)-N6)-methyltransferase TrmO [Candidatus Thiodiazotropha sp.]|jgi:tRNA (adenine37-N6)-methyltransferase
MKFTFKPIGIIHSCFKEKFGIPRQCGLIPDAEAQLEILPPYNRPEAFRELEDYSHVWITFVFHAVRRDDWKPMVRPPRLGGNQRVGVFASRSPFRPNPIGLSALKLLKLECSDARVVLHLGGIDLLDGTPVLDIKPYVPYSDSIADARAGFAPTPPGNEITLDYSPMAEQFLNGLSRDRREHLKRLTRQVLTQDPRPAYLEETRRSQFGMRLYDYNFRWTIHKGHCHILEISEVEDLK